jgi:putative selenate reductase
MSVGYDLAGIKTEKIDEYITTLKNAAGSSFFQQCRSILYDEIRAGLFADFSDESELVACLESLPERICSSVTLSTMHGCPPEDIETICRYLLNDKKLHVYVKLNPTLLGYERVSSILHSLGYDEIMLDKDTFTHDLQYPDAVAMLNRLQQYAGTAGRQFGVKLSNTLGVKNSRGILPGQEMYLSGRPLFPLTIHLAAQLSGDWENPLPVSFSGGACAGNIVSILRAGVRSVTLATDLLKPGGYARLNGIVERVAAGMAESPFPKTVSSDRLARLATSAMTDPYYAAGTRQTPGIKIPDPLPLHDCYTAPCRHACPIGQDIPRYIRLVEEGRFSDACAVILDRNPLPHITGYICDHQCMQKCTRHDYDSPLEIRELKRAAAENGFDDCCSTRIAAKEKNTRPAAVIGAGPAGLATACFLARAGFSVTVFEKEQQAGGIVRNVIPGFRLPQEVIEKDIAGIARLGVDFHFDQQYRFSVSELQKKGFAFICLAIGAAKSTELSLDGDNPHLYTAIDFLWQCKGNPKRIIPGKRVAVVGGGNSAMDGARAALREDGVEEVYILYRRTREFMPADREEFDNAITDGVIFRECLSPVSYSAEGILTCQVMELGEPDASGRKRPVPLKGIFETFSVDSVISAIGEKVDADLLTYNTIRLDGSRVIVNPATLETNIPGVYIAGDARRGPSTVVESIADGRTVAEAICAAAGIPFPQNPVIAVDDKQRISDAHAAHGRVVAAKVPIDTPQAAMAEAHRCLACDAVCEKCVQVCPNRANVVIHIPDPQILHLDGLCNECGNCETFCPWHGSPFKDKLTLFWTESDYRNSTNPGFFLPPYPETASALMRIGVKEFTLSHTPGEPEFSLPAEAGEVQDAARSLTLINTIIHSYPCLISAAHSA